MSQFARGARRLKRRGAALIAAAFVCECVQAQSATDGVDVEGIQAGWAVIAPSLTMGYSYDTNVLQLSDDTVPPPEPDQVLTLQPAILVTIPFSNSSFQFGDVLTYVDYNNTPQGQGKISNDAVANLTLNFGSLDQLEISAHNVDGVAETLAFDPGGEIGFQGNNFTLHSEAIVFGRMLSGARGYRFGLERNALRFETTIAASFYNYRGFDGEAFYFQPLSSNTRLGFGYVGSRYDQSDPTDPSVVTRTENGDTLFCQIEGRFGPRQPYMARVGWERLTFGGVDTAGGRDYTGIVGELSLSFIVGGGTTFTTFLQRQPYRSYDEFNTYYVSNLIAATVERAFLSGAGVGGRALFALNDYDQPTTIQGETFYRHDRRVQLEAHANIALAERVAFRVSLARNRRYSNAPGADYNNTVVFGGFVLGWI